MDQSPPSAKEGEWANTASNKNSSTLAPLISKHRRGSGILQRLGNMNNSPQSQYGITFSVTSKGTTPGNTSALNRSAFSKITIDFGSIELWGECK